MVAWQFYMLLMSSVNFFFLRIILFKNISGALSECQTVMIQIRANPDLAQTVGKVYQRTTIGAVKQGQFLL